MWRTIHYFCQEIQSLLKKTQQQGVRSKLLIESWNEKNGASTYYCLVLFTMTNATDVTNDPQIPPLRYQGQTPMVNRNVQKRPFLVLSSTSSETEKLLMNKIETIQQSIKTKLPGLIETLNKSSFN